MADRKKERGKPVVKSTDHCKKRKRKREERGR